MPQSTERIKWHISLLHLIVTYVHCTHMRQAIHDSKMSDINTFTIMFDVLWYWCHWSLAGRYTWLRIANKRYDITVKGTCYFLALPYLDDDRETTCHMLVSWYLYFKIHLFGEQDKESATPWLWQTCTWDSWGIKWFQTHQNLVWNHLIPHSSQALIYHIKV